ncbi:MAG: GNAT family N-acetyltransferase [Fimbriimonadaceae bacterium]|nr:GNAT family N-acetyltransferase [Chitinophagales bacterium]
MQLTPTYRIATIEDIKELHVIRMSVKENVLSNSLLVTEKDYIPFLIEHGKGWLCEIKNEILGFAIIDIRENNIWALFIKPGYEKMGIGKTLHDKMLKWFFTAHKNTLWLTTAPGTRAEHFYRAAGWKETHRKQNGEIHFEMTYGEWSKK